jgi:protein transport protein SEC24
MYEFEKLPEDVTGEQAARLRRINKNFVFVQTALLYSTSEGQRRIRSHNLAIPLTNQINEGYEYLDITATSAFITRKALRRFQSIQNIDAVRGVIDAMLNNMTKTCQRYAKLQRGEQFQFSDNMTYFIMYCLGMIKSQIITLPMIM